MTRAHIRLTAVNRASIVAFVLGGLIAAAPAANAAQTYFPSPKEGLTSLVDALRKNDTTTLQAILGPQGDEILSSGDPVVDKDARDRFLTSYDQKSNLVNESPNKVSINVGNDDWPMPIPLVRDAQGWRFDTAAGKQELLNRRVGRDELSVIQVCLAYGDAQREYATFDRDGDGILEYAQRFMSSPGAKDGLYWPTKAGEPASPLGDEFVTAQAKGYTAAAPSGQPQPYFGYYYRILSAQGANAKDGARDYTVNGNMIGGFAMVAYPATYGNSGIMTFMVNQDGDVFAKDLGEKTSQIARAITKFDPDKTWKKQDLTMPSGLTASVPQLPQLP